MAVLRSPAAKTFLAALAAAVLITTGACPGARAAGIPPNAPASVSATLIPPAGATVSWAAATTVAGGAPVVGYYLYRDGVYLTIINATSYTDALLAPGVHTYTVAAYDAAGNVSATPTPASVTVVLDTTPPTVPTGVAATASPTSTAATVSVTVSWNASTDNVGVAGYSVYRGNTLLNAGTPSTATSYTDQNLPPGTYTYTVRAYDAAGNTSDKSAPASLTVYLDVIPPSVPTHATATLTATQQVILSWATSTDEVGVKGYRVYRDGTQVSDGTATSYTDSPPPGTHAYTVAAYDAAGNVSARSGQASVTIFQDTAPPTPPGNLTVTALASTTARISWAPSFDDVSVTGYTVYRNGTSLGTTTSTSYVDANIATGTYAYTVSASDIAGYVSNQPIAVNVTVPLQTGLPSAPAPQPLPLPAAPTSSSSSSGVSAAVPRPASAFTSALRSGSRGSQVRALQRFLITRGYLSPGLDSGFFGPATMQAVKKFQCDWGIVCRGTPALTGWGAVGARTRAILNKLSQ